LIICHRHRFIFVKTKKTAGTSIEIALSRYCGENDIITVVAPEDEALRAELGYPGPQNDALPLRSYRPWDLKQIVQRRDRMRFRNHAHASWLRRRIPREVWEGYFKFCVERNPWDRIMSSYYWRNRHLPELPPFDDWLKTISQGQLSNYGIYSIGGRVAVDRVLRYEDLGAELDRVAEELKLPGKLELPRAKGGYRADRRPYHEVLEPRHRDLIASACVREIELMGYEF
jgi:hypothetical protein